MKHSLCFIIKTFIWKIDVRQFRPPYVDLETSQYPWDGGFGLGNANDRAQKDGRNDPEVQSREGNAVGFHIDEDGITGSTCCCGCRSEDSNSNCSDEESLGDYDWKKFCRPIRGKCASGLADRSCKVIPLIGIVKSAA